MIQLERHHLRPKVIFSHKSPRYFGKWMATIIEVNANEETFTSKVLLTEHGTPNPEPFKTRFSEMNGYVLMTQPEPTEEMPKTSLTPASAYMDLLK